MPEDSRPSELLALQLFEQAGFVLRVQLIPVDILKGASQGEQQSLGGSESASPYRAIRIHWATLTQFRQAVDAGGVEPLH